MRRDPVTTARARELRRNSNDAEKRMWYFLRGRQLAGFKFRRQYPIDDYIGDFVCLQARLVVELDGETHGDDDRQLRDAQRTETLQRAGYRVIRFWNDQVFTNMDGVTEEIWNALQKQVPSPLRGAISRSHPYRRLRAGLG
jgi:very-short-patch-repair endonuclease